MPTNQLERGHRALQFVVRHVAWIFAWVPVCNSEWVLCLCFSLAGWETRLGRATGWERQFLISAPSYSWFRSPKTSNLQLARSSPCIRALWWRYDLFGHTLLWKQRERPLSAYVSLLLIVSISASWIYIYVYIHIHECTYFSLHESTKCVSILKWYCNERSEMFLTVILIILSWIRKRTLVFVWEICLFISGLFNVSVPISDYIHM
jgi:hypothetical protein